VDDYSQQHDGVQQQKHHSLSININSSGKNGNLRNASATDEYNTFADDFFVDDADEYNFGALTPSPSRASSLANLFSSAPETDHGQRNGRAVSLWTKRQKQRRRRIQNGFFGSRLRRWGNLGRCLSWICSPHLGTFSGSFVPSLLQFLGVVFWIRLPKLVGYGGILGSLLAFLLSYTISVVSMTAFAALVSNEKIPHGPTGVYYILSRNSAAVVGGSLGILLFCANFLSAAFFLVGFGNSFVEFVNVAFDFRGDKWYRYLFDSIAWAVICVLTVLGKRIFTKALVSIFLFSMVGISLIFASLLTMRTNTSLKGYTGISWDTFKQNIMPRFSDTFPVTDLISLVLPTTAAIVAAANLSGDLKTPYPSYHRGTLGSTLCTFSLYIVAIVLLGSCVMREELKNHIHLMIHIPWDATQWVTAAGMFLVMISSAIISLLGAGRVLHSMSRDGFFPYLLRPFRIRFKFLSEPFAPILFIYVLIQILLTFLVLFEVSGTREGEEIIFLARFISTIYLLAFAFTNLNVFLLHRSGAPNFRPLFRYHSWQLSFFGFIACLVIMFIVNTVYASVAVALLLLLFTLLLFVAPQKKEWGNLIQAVFYHQARKYLLLLEEENVKFWRLELLLVLDSKDGHDQIMKFCNYLKKGGLYIIGHVVEGNFVESVELVQREKEAWEERCRAQQLKAFSQVSVATSVRKGIQQLLLMSGLGHMKPNTIMLGLYSARNILNEETSDKYARMPLGEYVKTLRDIVNLRKNLMLHYGFDNSIWKPPKFYLHPSLSGLQKGENSRCYVDMYPLGYTHLSSDMGIDATISMIIQTASILIRSHNPWKKMQLRICSIVDSEQKVKKEKQYLAQLLRICRIRDCRIKVTVLEPEHFSDLNSGSASLSSHLHAEIGSLSFLFDNLSLRDKYRLINRVIRENVSETSVVFVPLPEVPLEVTGDNDAEYIERLREMSHGFGENGTAIVMVYGSQSVISVKL